MHTEGQKDSNVSCYRIGNEHDRHLPTSHQAHVLTALQCSAFHGRCCLAIVVKCAGKTFIHLILSDSNDDAPQFLCINEDPVVVTLTDEERQQLERAI
jgi:hypothetical protein